MDEHLQRITDAGFAVVHGVFTSTDTARMLHELEQALRQQPEAVAIRSNAGAVYAARNILALWPDAATVWRRPLLPQLLTALLGARAGLVRGLYFDKPPERSWALPWHKDLTIAVRDNRLPSGCFSKPTVKASVPHVEAPLHVLENMVTVRIHLDEVNDENGPLRVVPGSHRAGKAAGTEVSPPESILVQAGDVLLIRPLLAHASSHSAPETRRHRRILHLEFSGTAELPDGYEWFDFRGI